MSTAAVIGAPPAPVGRRVLAALIDGLGTTLCALPIWLSAAAGLGARGADATPVLSTVPTVIGGGLLLAWGVVQWVLHGTKGWTIGRRLLGLRVVDALTGRPIGLGRALVRALIVGLGSLACGVGQWVVLASVFWDPTGRRRGWHDRIAEAIVVDVRAAPAAGRMGGYRARPVPSTPPSPAAPSPQASVPPPLPTTAAATPQASAPPVASHTAWPPASTVGAGPLSGATPAVPRRPGDPVPPEQTRWAGMVAAGGTIPEPGLVLPPLRTPYTAPQPPQDMPSGPVRGRGADDPTTDLPAAEPTTSEPDSSVDDLPAWTGRPATNPPTADPDSARTQDAARPSLAEPPREPSTMRDTTQIPTVPAAVPAAGTVADPGVPPMDSFWSDPTPTGTGATPGRSSATTGYAPDVPGHPGGPAVSAVSAPEPPTGWAARLPDGSVLDLDPGPVLIGRNPAGLVGLRTVAVADPGMSVSKTHLVIGADAAGAWVMDRASTNGTLVTLPDGEKIVCLPDQRVRVAPGSVVFFGDLSLTIGLVDPG